MKCRTIAVANMKGGVGKTTLVVFLAEALAADNPKTKVLIIDADPQASASVSIMGDEKLRELIEDGRTIDSFLNDNLVYPSQPISMRLSDLACGNVSTTTNNNIPLDLDLLPCGTHLRLVEKDTVRNFAQHGLGPDAYEMRLWDIWKKELELLRRKYDYIIMDCAPSLSALNEMMIRSADLVLLPTIPDFISSFGLNAFLKSVWNYPIANLPKPKRLPYVVISKFQSNLKQHKASVRDLEEEAAAVRPEFAICKTYVPNSVLFSEALAKGGDEYPTFTNKYSPKIIIEVIEPLTDEIRKILDVYAPR